MSENKIFKDYYHVSCPGTSVNGGKREFRITFETLNEYSDYSYVAPNLDAMDASVQALMDYIDSNDPEFESDEYPYRVVHEEQFDWFPPSTQ